MDKKKKASKRTLAQFLSALLMNGNLKGFWTGKIYTGGSKRVCLPVLNCYSCPGALGACPIGSLQATAGNGRSGWSFYILGFLALMGVLLGRFLCGWLCLFGLIQDLLYKIPVPKVTLPKKLDKSLRWVKYVNLVVFVLLMPLLFTGKAGTVIPYFCKYICPAGTLEGSIPLLLANKPLRNALGPLYSWKFFVLAVVIVASILIYRPFCKYMCPLGAFYGLFNRFSFLRYQVDSEKCVGCGKCAKVCKMGVDPVESPNSPECIRCGDCKAACPTGAICRDCMTKHTMEETKR